MTAYLHDLAAPFTHDGERVDTVVLLHGWTGSPAHLRLLGRAVADAGYGVVAPVLAGHATHIDHLMDTTWRDWLRSAAAAAQQVVDQGRRLHLAGLSMGGIIGLLMAPVFGAASVTTINAPQHVRSRWTWAAPLLRRRRFLLPAPSVLPPAGEGADYYHHYEGNPVGTAADVLDLAAAARRTLGRVTCPALIIQSRTDETVDPVSAEIIYHGLGSNDKHLVWLASSRHLATIDHEHEIIEEEVLRHLERC